MANSQSSINDSYNKAIKNCDAASKGFLSKVSDLKTYRSILEQIYATLLRYEDNIITAQVPAVINKLNVYLFEALSSNVDANIAVGISVSNIQSTVLASITKALTKDLIDAITSSM